MGRLATSQEAGRNAWIQSFRSNPRDWFHESPSCSKTTEAFRFNAAPRCVSEDSTSPRRARGCSSAVRTGARGGHASQAPEGALRPELHGLMHPIPVGEEGVTPVPSLFRAVELHANACVESRREGVGRAITYWVPPTCQRPAQTIFERLREGVCVGSWLSGLGFELVSRAPSRSRPHAWASPSNRPEFRAPRLLLTERSYLLPGTLEDTRSIVEGARDPRGRFGRP